MSCILFDIAIILFHELGICLHASLISEKIYEVSVALTDCGSMLIHQVHFNLINFFMTFNYSVSLLFE